MLPPVPYSVDVVLYTKASTQGILVVGGVAPPPGQHPQGPMISVLLPTIMEAPLILG